MKILITGAHFTPAVAVIEQLKQNPEVSITYVGRNTTREGDRTQSIESQVLPELGIKFISIIAGKVQRHFNIFTIISLFKIPIGFIQAFMIVLTEKPDVILSFGGYISVPVVFSGWLWSVPIIIHEQTLVSGLANKFSSIFADKICVSFKQNYSENHPKVVLTGNPMRKEVLEIIAEIPEDLKNLFKEAKMHKLPMLFITGGNQGSHIINETVEKILEKLLEKSCVVHQTGDSSYQDFERLVQKQNARYIVRKWIGPEIGNLLKKVDLAVSRAGANTLTEFAYLGVPALVIPLPYLYNNEQLKNAEFFQKFGFIKILPQSKLTKESLLESINKMLDNLAEYKNNTKQAKTIVIPDAAKRLALETLLLVK